MYRNKWPGNRGLGKKNPVQYSLKHALCLCSEMWSNVGPVCGTHQEWILKALKPVVLLLLFVTTEI